MDSSANTSTILLIYVLMHFPLQNKTPWLMSILWSSRCVYVAQWIAFHFHEQKCILNLKGEAFGEFCTKKIHLHPPSRPSPRCVSSFRPRPRAQTTSTASASKGLGLHLGFWRILANCQINGHGPSTAPWKPHLQAHSDTHVTGNVFACNQHKHERSC